MDYDDDDDNTPYSEGEPEGEAEEGPETKPESLYMYKG